MSKPRLPGPHYVGPFDESTILNEYWPNIRACEYPWITVVCAGQYKEANDFANGVQNDPIRTQVIGRHWKEVAGSPSDNGRMSVLTASEWMDRVGSLHLGSKCAWMPDNEGLGEVVASRSAQLVPMASKEYLRLALGAWFSHHPVRDTWPGYMSLFEQLYAHPEHVYVPHIYYSRWPSVENFDAFRNVAAHLAHVEQMMTAPIPFEVVISEFGRLQNRDGAWLDPDRGYQLEGVSDPEYAHEIAWLTRARVLATVDGEQRDMAEKWDYCVFSHKGWGTRNSLGVGKDFLDEMEKYADGRSWLPDAPVIIVPPPYPPAPNGPPDRNTVLMGLVNRLTNDPDWIVGTARKADPVADSLIRAKPTRFSQEIGRLRENIDYPIHFMPFAALTATEQIAATESDTLRWTQIMLPDQMVGWVRSDAATVQALPPVIEPPPPPPADEEGSDKSYAAQVAILHEQRSAVYTTLAAIERNHAQLIRSLIEQEVNRS